MLANRVQFFFRSYLPVLLTKRY